MRVIVVTVEPPDPFGNAASRWSYVLLNGLVERGHDVTMLSTSSVLASTTRAETLFPSPTYDLRCFAEGRHSGLRGKLKSLREPYSYVFSRELKDTLNTLCSEGVDVLHLEHLWSGWVGWRYAKRALLNVHYLFSSDFAEVEPHGAYDRMRRLGTFAAERRILAHYPNVAALSDRLVQDIQNIAPHTRARVLPLGIDTSLYPFSPEDPPGPPTVGIIGNFSWTPTQEAAKRIRATLWPRVKAAVPNARLLFVGRDAVKRMGQSGRQDIEIVENVAEIQPYFRRLHTLLYPPPHGSGTKVKVQEAMAIGVPVVTNTDGGEGIPARDGEHWAFADDDDGLVQRTVSLLENASLRRARRIAARALLERVFGPKPTIDAVLSSYELLVDRLHTRPAISVSEPSGERRAR